MIENFLWRFKLVLNGLSNPYHLDESIPISLLLDGNFRFYSNLNKNIYKKIS